MSRPDDSAGVGLTNNNLVTITVADTTTCMTVNLTLSRAKFLQKMLTHTIEEAEQEPLRLIAGQMPIYQTDGAIGPTSSTTYQGR